PTSVTHLLCLKQPPIPEIYTLSLHDALPIYAVPEAMSVSKLDLKLLLLNGREPAGVMREFKEWIHAATVGGRKPVFVGFNASFEDRKSTRLNSSHGSISYAVFCLKKKKPDK